MIELNEQIETLNQRNYQTNCVSVIEQYCVRLFIYLFVKEMEIRGCYLYGRRGTNLGAKRTNPTAEMVGGDATRSVFGLSEGGGTS